jgi:hypothetical protein
MPVALAEFHFSTGYSAISSARCSFALCLAESALTDWRWSAGAGWCLYIGPATFGPAAVAPAVAATASSYLGQPLLAC